MGKGKVIHMKKRLFLILSVSVMLIAGCGNKNNAVADMETEVTETVTDTEEQDMAGNTEMPAEEQTESGETEKGQTGEKEMPERKEDAGAEETPEPQSVSQPEQKEAAEPAQSSTDVPKQEETKPEEPKPECEAKPEETKPQEQPEEPAVTAVSYDPVSVCSKAVAKCQAGGMITTTDNLANLLSEGKITQEEYNSYYPYDGLGYYSVFVETDLNKASTTSGRNLGSEDEIADYIAGMMLLETEPVFNIGYAGVYNLNGTDFYEFRCYR